MRYHEVLVIGGGITGRLIGTLCPVAQIVDWSMPPEPGQDRLTVSFGTNYLWEQLEGLEMDYVSFPVETTVDGMPPTPDSIRAYKRKINKEFDQRNWSEQFFGPKIGHVMMRWPVPANPIAYGERLIDVDLEQRIVRTTTGYTRYLYLLTTIPLYAFVQACRPREAFQKRLGDSLAYSPIYVASYTAPIAYPDTPSTLYVDYLTSPKRPEYRIARRGSFEHAESLEPMPGLECKKLVPGKIQSSSVAVDVVTALKRYRVYSFGRYATWRSDELVHQTYAEIREWIEQTWK